MGFQGRKFYNAMNQEFDPGKEYGRVLRFDPSCHAYVHLAIYQAKQVVPRELWSGIQIFGDTLETCDIGALEDERKTPAAIFAIAWRWTPGQSGFSGCNGKWVFDCGVGCLRWVVHE